MQLFSADATILIVPIKSWKNTLKGSILEILLGSYSAAQNGPICPNMVNFLNFLEHCVFTISTFPKNSLKVRHSVK